MTNYTETESQFLIGEYNNTGFLRTTDPASITIESDTLPNGEWIFDTDVSFGVLNTTVGTGNLSTQAYFDVSNSTFNQLKIASNFDGILLPEDQLYQVQDYLNEWSNDIWECSESHDAFCYAPVWCNAFSGEENSSYNYTDVNFRFKFKGSTNADTYIRIPLYAFMRDGNDTQNPSCNLMVYKLRSYASSNPDLQLIVGQSLFQ